MGLRVPKSCSALFKERAGGVMGRGLLKGRRWFFTTPFHPGMLEPQVGACIFTEHPWHLHLRTLGGATPLLQAPLLVCPPSPLKPRSPPEPPDFQPRSLAGVAPSPPRLQEVMSGNR